MKRSLGVTVIAVLELLGSSLTLLMGIFFAVVMLVVPLPAPRDVPIPLTALKAIVALSSLFYILPAIWGIASGIGLLRLKNWARISTIVFSVILILMSVFSGLITVLVPLPNASGADPAVMAGFRLVMGLFWAALFSVGVWWLVFFTRANVKAQFVPPVNLSLSPPTPVETVLSEASSQPLQARAPDRPLSLTIIAWLLLIGCAFFPLSIAMRFPTFLLTKVVSGWPAGVYFLVAGALQLYIGIGLLRLQPLARTVGVWYYVAMMVNAGCFYFAPGSRVRFTALMEAQQKMFPRLFWMQNQPEFHFDPLPFMYVGACFGIIVIAIPIYLLVTRKAAFERAAASVELNA